MDARRFEATLRQLKKDLQSILVELRRPPATGGEGEILNPIFWGLVG
jgi:hypothetical protein